MKVFIIGGSGFISGRLTQMLLDEGHRVTILTRGLSRTTFRGDERLERVSGDRRSARSILQAVESATFDAAFDMIAYDADDSRSAVNALKGRVGRFIHCSTVSVYMISAAVRCPITEDQAQLPVMGYWPRNPFGMDYGIKKRSCEEVLWDSHDPTFPVTVLRPTYVSGPGDPTARDFFWMQRILDGRGLVVPGSGDHAFQQLFVNDAARAFADVLNHDASMGKAYNIAGDDIYSLNEYLRLLADLLGRDVDLTHVDQATFDALPVASHPRGDVFPFNTRRTAVFSLEKIKRDVAYRPTPFRDWMQTTIEWYANEHAADSLGYDRRGEEVALIRKMRGR